MTQVGRQIIPFLFPAALLVVWEIGTRLYWFPQSLISSPSEVISTMVRLIGNGEAFHHSLVSLQRLSIGFISGSVFAIFIGTLVGLSKMFDRLLGFTISMLAPVPVTAWIPLIIILAGIGEIAKYSVIGVGVFFVVYSGTVNGIRSTDSKLVEVARVCGKSPLSLTLQVLLPSALASIFQSMRGALGFGWVLLVVAEVIASTEGLGWFLWDARQFGRADDMVVGMILAGTLGASTDWLARRLQSSLLSWRPTFTGQ